MENNRLTFLWDRALAGDASSMEREELFVLMAKPEHKALVDQLLATAWDSFSAERPVFEAGKGDEILNRILEGGSRPGIKTASGGLIYWIRYGAVAAVLVIAALTFVIMRSGEVEEPFSLSEAVIQNGIRPGGEKATLSLKEGVSVDLDAKKQHIVVKKGNVVYDDGTAVLEATDAQVMYVLKTPRGGHYQVTLPDGTKVHLNAASSLRYPAVFKGKKREVELVGEGYFDVASDPEKPFSVKTRGQVTQVLGTSFNIAAYETTAPVETTLERGSVQVIKPSGKSVKLQPGQKVRNSTSTEELEVLEADLNEVLAWHKGYFLFNDEPIESIMEKVSRWYDVEVLYQGMLADKKFGGMFRRSKGLDILLKNFKETGLVDFKVEGRRVIVIAN